MRAAAQCLHEFQGAPTIKSCHAATVLSGVSLIGTDACDNANVLLHAVPVEADDGQLAQRAGSASRVALQESP